LPTTTRPTTSRPSGTSPSLSPAAWSGTDSDDAADSEAADLDEPEPVQTDTMIISMADWDLDGVFVHPFTRPKLHEERIWPVCERWERPGTDEAWPEPVAPDAAWLTLDEAEEYAEAHGIAITLG
jgi:hypothetical protein